ncbi:MAG TPA: hypothetical protein DDY13_14480 [Cytophagales bacterium]|jgi:glycosyltransferase involved in cell wall biosynthesis|nr:hypothetical protein [Cytophagales bacterium]
MKSHPKVSVLTTVYNREKYLAACIESVLASTFQDWELIVVDDQSADNSVAIARSYAVKDQRIRVFVNETNLGDYPNRNKAASYARGTYLKYLDADDLIYPHGLEIMVHTMEQFPEAAMGISQQVAEDVKPYPFLMTPKEIFEREFLQRGVLGLGPTATIIRRKAFEMLDGFSGTRYIGDMEMWYKIALKYSMVKMVPGLIYWRQHEDQEISKGLESYFYLENTFKFQIETLEYKDLPMEEEDRRTALNLVKKRFARNIFRMVKQGKIKAANKVRQACSLSWPALLKFAITKG